MEWVMGIVPVILLLLGFPIFTILLATAAIVLLIFAPVPPMAVHINMFGSVDKFALITASDQVHTLYIFITLTLLKFEVTSSDTTSKFVSEKILS